MTISGLEYTGVVTAIVEAFPGTDPTVGVMVADFESLQTDRAARAGVLLSPNEWWMSSCGPRRHDHCALQQAPALAPDLVASIDGVERAARARRDHAGRAAGRLRRRARVRRGGLHRQPGDRLARAAERVRRAAGHRAVPSADQGDAADRADVPGRPRPGDRSADRRRRERARRAARRDLADRRGDDPDRPARGARGRSWRRARPARRCCSARSSWSPRTACSAPGSAARLRLGEEA